MCSTASINISDDSFHSDSSLSHVEAVNFGSFHPKQFSTCRSGKLKSLSLDRLCPPNPYLDSIVTKSLLDLTYDEKSEHQKTNQKVCDILQDSTDFAQLSATILGNPFGKTISQTHLWLSDNTGVFNSFDTTIACDDILVNVDDIDDNDSGVINTPDNLRHEDIEVLEAGHPDSLYESLKPHHQSHLKLCPVLYRSLVTSLNLMTRVSPHDHDHNMCQHCQLYIHNIDTLLEALTNPNKAKKVSQFLCFLELNLHISDTHSKRDSERDNCQSKEGRKHSCEW